ncbi:MAG: DNA polymerase III subunit chi [Pseudomonadota bacterium]
MGKVMFYHLTRSSVDETTRMLIGKCLEAGWRVALRATDGERLAWLDEKLWLGPEDGFLPHGIAGGAHDAAQPVLLTLGAAGNGADAVIAVDQAEVAPGEAAALERICILFDGMDGAAVEHARGQWRAFKKVGAMAEYWSQESGSWEMKAAT